MTRALTNLIACCAGLLSVTVIGFAAETDSTSASRGPEDMPRTADWIEVVNSADVVTLRHTIFLLRPTGFETRKPCVYSVTETVAEQRFGGNTPARFAEALGLHEQPPDTLFCDSRRCDANSRRPIGASGDTLIGQSFRLTFMRPGREATFELGDHELMPAIGAPPTEPPCHPFPKRIPGLLALARQALPGDSLLNLIEPCTPASPSSGPPREYVYVEELPEAVQTPAPQYPREAQAANVSGTVLVQALIGTNGEVKSTQVIKSIPLLDQAAVQAVERWRFRPAKAQGKPVAIWVAVPVRFSNP